MLTAAAHGVTDLLIYRAIAGIGLGGALPNALALTGEYCPKRRRATLVVIMFCGFSLGSILGGGLTATFIARFGWRAIFSLSEAHCSSPSRQFWPRSCPNPSTFWRANRTASGSPNWSARSAHDLSAYTLMPKATT